MSGRIVFEQVRGSFAGQARLGSLAKRSSSARAKGPPNTSKGLTDTTQASPDWDQGFIGMIHWVSDMRQAPEGKIHFRLEGPTEYQLPCNLRSRGTQSDAYRSDTAAERA